jgi:hypothetical protein
VATERLEKPVSRNWLRTPRLCEYQVDQDFDPDIVIRRVKEVSEVLFELSA